MTPSHVWIGPGPWFDFPASTLASTFLSHGLTPFFLVDSYTQECYPIFSVSMYHHLAIRTGDFSEAFNSMIISLDHNEKLLKKKIDELEKALSQIIKLEGILPICSNCKKIRLESADPKNQDSWIQIESYISNRTEAQFSHGICPECMKKLYPELMG